MALSIDLQHVRAGTFAGKSARSSKRKMTRQDGRPARSPGLTCGGRSVHIESKFSTLSMDLMVGLKGDGTWGRGEGDGRAKLNHGQPDATLQQTAAPAGARSLGWSLPPAVPPASSSSRP